MFSSATRHFFPWSTSTECGSSLPENFTLNYRRADKQIHTHAPSSSMVPNFSAEALFPLIDLDWVRARIQTPPRGTEYGSNAPFSAEVVFNLNWVWPPCLQVPLRGTECSPSLPEEFHKTIHWDTEWYTHACTHAHTHAHIHMYTHTIFLHGAQLLSWGTLSPDWPRLSACSRTYTSMRDRVWLQCTLLSWSSLQPQLSVASLLTVLDSIILPILNIK